MSATTAFLKAMVKARLAAVGYFSDVPIFTDDEKSLVGKIKLALGDDVAAGERVGVFMVVTVQRSGDHYLNSLVPPVEHELVVQAFENVDDNRDSTRGIGKLADDLCRKAYEVLKNFRLAGSFQVLGVDNAVTMIGRNPFTNFGAQANLVAVLADRTPRAKVATPAITVADGQCTITCATVGASIYYTTDGETYPSVADGGTLYSGAFAVSSGATVRAGATYSAAGVEWLDSDVETVEA